VILRVAQILAVGLVAALLGLLVWRLAHRSSGAAFVSEIAAGKSPEAPEFSLKPIWRDDVGASPRLQAAVRRGQVTVADLGGRPTIVNVYASWCGPCKDEAPLFAAASRQYAGRVQFVGLDYHDFESDGRALLHRYGADYTALHDGDGKVATRWGITGVPETYVLDPSGHVVAHVAAAVGTRELQPLIAAALASSN
jgi:cytochrome c biogenesis protein CcmG/thiol:disulfide interchange protein DsbE